MERYSKKEAGKMLCRYHNLDGAEALSGKSGAEKIMGRIHSIQYDPLNVAARNADLVLQARVADYREEILYHLLYQEHTLVDGFDKEMCIYEAADFPRFGLVRKENRKRTASTLKYRNQTGVMDILDDVRDFVARNGKTGAKDISIGEVRESRWGHKKLSSAALDYLFNSGELCVADKHGTQKYFDLTERVLGEGSRVCVPDMTIEEFLEWYTERRIQSVGFLWNKKGGGWQGHFLGENEVRSAALQRLAEKNRVREIQVEEIGETFYVSEDFYECLKYQPTESYARFLAPLDNMMWDRNMLEALFDFSYRWEVYTPVAKRKFGYYVLPVLYNGRFVARFEPQPVRRAGEFVIKSWWWEPGVRPDDEMRETIAGETARFAEFLQADNSPGNLALISAGNEPGDC